MIRDAKGEFVNIKSVQETRESFRPEKVATLFVGESTPAAGVFFYYGNSGMTRYMRRAIEEVCGMTSSRTSKHKVGISTILF
jgi:hypothetical protein